jgi:hypothetical protein
LGPLLKTTMDMCSTGWYWSASPAGLGFDGTEDRAVRSSAHL